MCWQTGPDLGVSAAGPGWGKGGPVELVKKQEGESSVPKETVIGTVQYDLCPAVRKSGHLRGRRLVCLEPREQERE